MENPKRARRKAVEVSEEQRKVKLNPELVKKLTQESIRAQLIEEERRQARTFVQNLEKDKSLCEIPAFSTIRRLVECALGMFFIPIPMIRIIVDLFNTMSTMLHVANPIEMYVVWALGFLALGCWWEPFAAYNLLYTLLLLCVIPTVVVSTFSMLAQHNPWFEKITRVLEEWECSIFSPIPSKTFQKMHIDKVYSLSERNGIRKALTNGRMIWYNRFRSIVHLPLFTPVFLMTYLIHVCPVPKEHVLFFLPTPYSTVSYTSLAPSVGTSILFFVCAYLRHVQTLRGCASAVFHYIPLSLATFLVEYGFVSTEHRSALSVYVLCMVCMYGIEWVLAFFVSPHMPLLQHIWCYHSNKEVKQLQASVHKEFLKEEYERFQEQFFKSKKETEPLLLPAPVPDSNVEKLKLAIKKELDEAWQKKTQLLEELVAGKYASSTLETNILLVLGLAFSLMYMYFMFQYYHGANALQSTPMFVELLFLGYFIYWQLLVFHLPVFPSGMIWKFLENTIPLFLTFFFNVWPTVRLLSIVASNHMMFTSAYSIHEKLWISLVDEIRERNEAQLKKMGLGIVPA